MRVKKKLLKVVAKENLMGKKVQLKFVVERKETYFPVLSAIYYNYCLSKNISYHKTHLWNPKFEFEILC